MASLSSGGGLGNILDSAVKTAVTHLASSPAGIDRSRVDFLYYDDGSPPYYDYYYDDHDDHQYLDDDNIEPPTDSLISPPERNYKPPNPPGWTKHFTPKPPHWARENQNNFPPQPTDDQYTPQHYGVPPRRRVDRQSSLFSLSTLTPYIPLLVILPVIAAASYYLIVQNGPTPVVKEREARHIKDLPMQMGHKVLSLTNKYNSEEIGQYFQPPMNRKSVRIWKPRSHSVHMDSIAT